MAVTKFYDAVVTINGSGGPPPTGGTALPHVGSVSVNYSAAMLDITEMGNTAKMNMAGLLDWSIDVEMFQDFAALSVDSILWPLVGAAKFYIQVKPTSAAISATNPQYYGYCVLDGYGPMSGKVGDLISVKVSFKSAGNITRSET